jgi:hypothetical protein
MRFRIVMRTVRMVITITDLPLNGAGLLKCPANLFSVTA